jgi:hypothetical protein
MVSGSARRPTRRAVARCFAIALVALVGCALFREVGLGGDDAQWQVARFKGVSAGEVLRLAQTAVEREYPPQRLDPYRGEFETGWIYGFFDDVRRHPLRQRIVVEVRSDDGLLVVRLRAEQQVNETAGRLASAFDEGWEKFADDPVRAQTMMQRLCILLKDIAELVPEPKEGEKNS